MLLKCHVFTLACAALSLSSCKKDGVGTATQGVVDAPKLLQAAAAPKTGLQAKLKCKERRQADRLLPGECSQDLVAENAIFSGKNVESCPEEHALPPQAEGWHLIEKSERDCYNGSTGLQLVFKAAQAYDSKTAFVQMQDDGDVAFYASNDASAAKLKTTGTAGHPGAFLQLRPSYKLVVMPADGGLPVKADFDTL